MNIYKCEVGSEVFDCTGTSQRHKLIHTDEKPHKCDFCENSFNSPSHLQTHHRVHTG